MELKIYLFDTRDISIDDLLSAHYVSPIEKESFEKYKVESVKKEKIASSYLKNKYIHNYRIDENGKPVSNSQYFNISHSHGIVVLVIDTVPVGIDIEMVRPVKEELVKYVSTEEEKEYIEDEASFYEIWTNKEALVKAYGTGIKQKPDTIVALPINGIRKYKDKIYYNKTINYQGYIIAVSREGNEDYTLDIILENESSIN